MILVDTSVWIDHLRNGDAQLAQLLDIGNVACHPVVIGEVALGSLKQRKLVVSLLQKLPFATTASDAEALYFLEQHKLNGTGLGYGDLHLLAAARLSTMQLWSRDKRLKAAAQNLGIGLLQS